MSQMVSVRIAGVVAVLSLAAAPFAIGGELPGWLLRPATNRPVSVTHVSATPALTATVVERSAKSDRGVIAIRSHQATRTFSIQPAGIHGTSILLRIPTQLREATNAPAGHIKSQQLDSKPRLACEPAVSVLTAIAKQLAPGRCVT